MPTASGLEHPARYAQITRVRQGPPCALPFIEKASEYIASPKLLWIAW